MPLFLPFLFKDVTLSLAYSGGEDGGGGREGGGGGGGGRRGVKIEGKELEAVGGVFGGYEGREAAATARPPPLAPQGR